MIVTSPAGVTSNALYVAGTETVVEETLYSPAAPVVNELILSAVVIATEPLSLYARDFNPNAVCNSPCVILSCKSTPAIVIVFKRQGQVL